MNFRILHYDQLDSTNNLALDFAAKKAAEGTVVLTDHQKRGRGQFERKWQSKAGKDLLFSVILRPKVKASAAPMITHLAARSVAHVLNERLRIKATLKKPNDVLVEGKKISGILTEAKTTKGNVEYVVVGIGLNVNSRKKDLLRTATSVYMEKGEESDKELILDLFLDDFRKRYEEGMK